MRNMACSLIEHKRIKTTVAKAKALRTFVEPLITKSKTDVMHSRRTVFSRLHNKYAVSELFREVAPKVRDRNGGYTRIIKIGNRLGDNAEMCYIELVDFNELMLADAKPAAKKSRRSRRGGGKGSSEGQQVAEAAVADAVGEEVTDAVAEEVTEAAAEETTEAVAEETTEAVAEETTEAVAEETTEAAAEETTEAAAEETTEAVAEETTEAVAEETAEDTNTPEESKSEEE